MSRNLFEENVTPEPEDNEGERPHIPLPPLAEGFWYELEEMPGGKTAVVIKGEVRLEE